MFKKWKKKISALLIIALIAVTFVPQLQAIADSADVIIGANGTAYDADYEHYILDEDEGDYDDDDDESEVTVLASDSDASLSDASASNASYASSSDWSLASGSNASGIFETVVFTDAGPFMPAVYVGSKRRMAMQLLSSSSSDTDNGLELKKTAEAVSDDSYKITLEAYTTGTFTSVETTTPVDIVLVLDQSGSMKKDFDGNSTRHQDDSRQYAMKEAVKNFIDSVNEKYSAAADHRIALVRFSSVSQTKTIAELTAVDTSGATTLKAAVDGLSADGDTYIGEGLKKAYDLMVTDYSYTGSNTNRQKVVIVFTDGMPAPSGTDDFNVDMANEGIKNAKLLKDNHVTVYSVGIFTGAYPAQLYGGDGFDPNSDGTINSVWRYRDDKAKADIPAGNRLLNYISNNFEMATEIGIIEDNATKSETIETWLGSYDKKVNYYGWKITANYDKSEDGYYLTAKDAASLNRVFQVISENISTSNESVNEESVIKDVVTEYFDMPADTSDIKIYTADYQGNGVFATRVLDNSITPTIDGNTVNVKGFDYYANFVSENGRSEAGSSGDDSFKGRKLIIEFTVTTKNGFLGGNNVPTNGETSGLYLTSEEKEAFENFDVPTVNVPVPAFTVEVEDKNVYLTGGLTSAEMMENSSAVVDQGTADTEDDIRIKLDSPDDNYGLKTWQTDYVKITAVTEPANDMTGLTADTTYGLNVTIEPSQSADASSSGDAAKTQNASATGNIAVFRPEITFADGTVYYGDDAPDTAYLDSCKLNTLTWKHLDSETNTFVYDNKVTIIGDVPAISDFKFEYELDATKLDNGKINTKEYVPVKFTKVTIDDSVVTSLVWPLRKECEGDTDKNVTLNGTDHFALHVKTCDLTITKSGGDEGDTFVFAVYKDGAANPYTYVRITGNGSKVLKELPVGTYSVEEDTDWAWRYTSSMDKSSVNLSSTASSGEVTCTNKKDNNSWLNSFGTVLQNIFGAKNGKKVSGND